MVGVDVSRTDRDEAVAQSDSSPIGGDSPTNGKITNDSEHFGDVTPVHAKISKYTEYLSVVLNEFKEFLWLIPACSNWSLCIFEQRFFKIRPVFTARRSASAIYAIVCLSVYVCVYVSVCLSHSSIVSKRLNLRSCK